jgi:rhodanese-related sulfurtransferase
MRRKAVVYIVFNATQIYIRLSLYELRTIGNRMLIDLKTRIDNIDYELRTITAKQAVEEITLNKGMLVDVREPAEVASQPVKGAVNIPRGVLEMKMLEQVKEAATPIYLHCASGMRAKLAAEQLINIGYEKVSVITCSIADINQAKAQ